jgi:glycerophosphoryl diester phosphodiesterase
VHRGAPRSPDGAVVENTLAAFQRAFDRGFRYFETDVHVTRDGQVVTSHDRSLRRVAGERVKVDSVDWNDLAEVAVGGRPLPRLIELLDTFPNVCFNIDPKADAAVAPLVDVLRSQQVLDRVCVTSFSDRRLRWTRAAMGDAVCTAASPKEIRHALGQVARGADIALPGVDVLQIPIWVGRWQTERAGRSIDLVRAARNVGLPVHVWTVNDEGDMDRLLARGVDGVMSDDLDALARVFGAYGWRPAAST